METAGDRPSMKSTSGLSIWPRNCRAYDDSDSTYRRWPSAKMVSNARLDLPDPDNPVKTISASRGRSRLTSRRLCSRAPRTTRRPSAWWLALLRSATAGRTPGTVGGGSGGRGSAPAGKVRRRRQDTGRCDSSFPSAASGVAMSAASDGTAEYTGQVEVGGTPDVRELPGLRVTKVAVGPYNNNCYLLRDAATGETLLVDAAAEPERLLAEIGDDRLVRVVQTHQHPDHWQALAAVVAATGAPVAAHAADAEALPVPATELVADGDVVTVGDQLGSRHREGLGVGRMRRHRRPGGGDHRCQRLPMVGVLVRLDHPDQTAVTNLSQQPLGLGGRVDEQRLAGRGIPQQIAVVVVRADRHLGDPQPGQLADIGGAAHLNLSGVFSRFVAGCAHRHSRCH